MTTAAAVSSPHLQIAPAQKDRNYVVIDQAQIAPAQMKDMKRTSIWLKVQKSQKDAKINRVTKNKDRMEGELGALIACAHRMEGRLKTLAKEIKHVNKCAAKKGKIIEARVTELWKLRIFAVDMREETLLYVGGVYKQYDTGAWTPNSKKRARKCVSV